eukprot:6039341-Alexandrium_andersonii.AAC.1
MLKAVKIDYSGPLSAFCNVLFVQRGPPGSGKSIWVWFQMQGLQAWSRRAEDRDVRLWKERRTVHEAWRSMPFAQQRETCE